MSLLLLTPDDNHEDRVRDALGASVDVQRIDPVVLGEDPRYAVPMILEHYGSGDVVFIGPEIDVQYALDFAYEFDLQRPDMSVIVFAPVSADVLGEALHAGVRDVVDPLAGDHRILDAYKRAVEATSRARSQVTAEERPTDAGGGRVIAVVSPKGGSGKTTVATNLAIGLSAAAPGEVAIVDLDLQFGDVATALQLLPEHTIADAARAVSSLDSMSLKVLLTHHPADLYALCAPESPAEGERITTAQTSGVIDVMKREFRYIVVDTAAGLGEQTLAAMEAANDVVLICSMDVPGVRSFRTTLATLDQIGMTSATRHIVLTRADSRVGLNIDDIERTIGRSIDVTIPSSRAVPLSINQGTPVLQSDQRRSTVYQAMQRLTGRFSDLDPSRSSESRLWRRRR
ncbi:MAG TPA: AAA family ATPase [Euzebyales bacterium]|nr:AAA family ATPase [Euzebyales bacterium]